MKKLLLLLSLLTAAHAQQAAPMPAKKPFTGFGGSALDKKPGGGQPTTGSLLPPRSSTPAPANPPAASGGSTRLSDGIALASDWEGHVTQATGGQTMKIADLRALLSGFGAAEADTGAHPDVTVYQGPPMDPAAGANCRVTYLMPLPQAEKLLFKSRGIVTSGRAVAPGFPDGLFLHTYDIKFNIYNRLTIVTDSAKPEQQVVSMLFKAEGENWYPPTPSRKIVRDWHTHDYVNTENRGSGNIVIDTRVEDARKRGRHIVVNTTGGFLADLELPPPGLLVKPARSSPKETTTWFVPEPLIKLILYCLAKQ